MNGQVSDRTRAVMIIAQKEALRLKHEKIDTSHILLGLLAVHGSQASAVLSNLGVRFDELRQEIEKLLPGPSEADVRGRLPQTQQAEDVAQYMCDAAHTLHASSVGTAHMLLGLLRNQDTVAAKALTTVGVTEEKVYEEVKRLP